VSMGSDEASTSNPYSPIEARQVKRLRRRGQSFDQAAVVELGGTCSRQIRVEMDRQIGIHRSDGFAQPRLRAA